ncbi:MAG: molybdopterin synthase sulfur carrier subunit [Myxococcota bacterium]|nr:molybdopterin synthase sulfur carrier subunit [Myxococcota bacterium]
MTVEIPPRYRGVTRGSKQVEVEALSVVGCLEAVEAAYPGFHELVLDQKGQVRRFVRLFLNGDELPRDDFDQGVGASDILSVVTGAAGG